MNENKGAVILGVVIFFIFTFLHAPMWLAILLGAFVTVSTIMANRR